MKFLDYTYLYEYEIKNVLQYISLKTFSKLLKGFPKLCNHLT